MAEMFGLLKELTASRTPKKEEKSVENSRETDKSVVEPRKSDEQEPPKEVHKTNEGGRRVDDEPAKVARENVTKNKKEEPAGVSSSHAVGYYLKHRINKKLIEGLIENQRFNDSLSATRIGKVKQKTYDLLPSGPEHDANLKKKITRKEDIGGNFEITCNVGGIAEDVLVDIASYVYPIDFVILDIREDEKRPFILGTLLLTTAKAVIKFDKGMITLKSRKSKISFHRIPEPHCRIEKGIKNDIEPISPTMTINRLVLEWEEKIKLHQEKEMKFDQ
ncbi:zinc finger, CCHC-type containing protein [Tanacetum coccineum]